MRPAQIHVHPAQTEHAPGVSLPTPGACFFCRRPHSPATPCGIFSRRDKIFPRLDKNLSRLDKKFSRRDKKFSSRDKIVPCPAKSAQQAAGKGRTGPGRRRKAQKSIPSAPEKVRRREGCCGKGHRESGAALTPMSDLGQIFCWSAARMVPSASLMMSTATERWSVPTSTASLRSIVLLST